MPVSRHGQVRNLDGATVSDIEYVLDHAAIGMDTRHSRAPGQGVKRGPQRGYDQCDVDGFDSVIMKKKYKYMLFAWCCSMSLLMGVMVTLGFIKYPDLAYKIAIVVYIPYVIIMAIGVRRISAKSREDPIRNDK